MGFGRSELASVARISSPRRRLPGGRSKQASEVCLATSQSSMTKRAPVYRWHLDAEGAREAVLVGELSQYNDRWEFVFAPEYLARGAQAWELDPTFVRSKSRTPFVHTGATPPPVFCDIALAGWALEALKQRAGDFLSADAAANPEPWSWWEKLVYAPADGFGALFVGEVQDKPAIEAALLRAVKEVTRATLPGGTEDSSSGAMGGERPKATAMVVLDGVADDDAPVGEPMPCIVKFALPTERADSVVAEATALTLAQKWGMRVPSHSVKVFEAVPALCIRRFDRGHGQHGAVYHCVSAGTVLGLTTATDPDDRRRNYQHLRSKLKRPGDNVELFHRIVLNAVVGNTDDHPWNTSLRQVALGDWELSPLYDVMPFFHREGCPTFRMAINSRNRRAATRENLVLAGRQIAGCTEAEVNELIDSMTRFVRDNWHRVFVEHSRALGDDTSKEWQRVFECPWLEA